MTNPTPKSWPDNGSILVVTNNEVPGHRVEEVYGEVFGLVVRARNYLTNLGAKARTVVGGEVAGYTTLLTDSRAEALVRLRSAARERGANAVIAMRFDCNEIGDIMSEVAAYGTAVKLNADPASATNPVKVVPIDPHRGDSEMERSSALTKADGSRYTALELDEAFARGQISRDEHRRLKAILQGRVPKTSEPAPDSAEVEDEAFPTFSSIEAATSALAELEQLNKSRRIAGPDFRRQRAHLRQVIAELTEGNAAPSP